MSLTGPPGGTPYKVGVGIADVMCGMYAAIGILAALRHRDATGEGQHIDLALVDSAMAWLVNEGTNFLTSNTLPERRGNAHPNIVPYDAFECADGHILLAVGNDAQFARFCDAVGLAQEPRFSTNLKRIENRAALMAEIAPVLRSWQKAELLERLQAAGVPCGPINTISEALESSQAKARGVSPGGDIMIHGIANGWGWLGGLHLLWDWTNGCIAVTDAQMREIWALVPDGTPIIITE